MAEETKITSTSDEKIDAAVEKIRDVVEYVHAYGKYVCFRAEVNGLYNGIVQGEDWRAKKKERRTIENPEKIIPRAAVRVYREKLQESEDLYRQCLQNEVASTNKKESPNTATATEEGFDPNLGAPFDRRLYRLVSGTGFSIIPYDTKYQDAGTTGFVVDQKTIREAKMEEENAALLGVKNLQKKLADDPFYKGVASVVNPYSMIKLYGSKGGQDLVDRKGARRWYEINGTQDDKLNYSSTPTTTSIINWGEGDPYGRTPYHFSDFVFCKHWNIVPNNRMITLRRFPAPIVDNMKFPGMGGFKSPGNAGSNSDDDLSGTKIENPALGDAAQTKENKDDGTFDQGDGPAIDFPPMATAVTYFGEETGNQLSEILSFTTGLNWTDVDDANVFEVQTQSNPEMGAGPGDAISGSMMKMSRMLNIATGNFDSNAMLNEGALPPDPYKDGPYENKIIGPVNAITSVKKRERGLKYTNDIKLTFEYVARPIGGVNTKAVLLDIISNFLVIGSATAMFWGGQHRFMGQPQKYPFIGGDKGIQEWYRGDPIGWGETAIDSFTDKVVGGGGFLDLAKNFMGDLLGAGGKGVVGGAKHVLSGNNPASNAIKAAAAARSGGAIPYLSGLRALLIGEPVGEWHVTIGNPLNPIAMIGNLICDQLEIEFGDELGPDDFPLDIKVIANLQHGMARDRDAIQSMFNRGMGRIYDLPDGFVSSADYETGVDDKSGNNNTAEGGSPTDWRLGAVIGGAATSGGASGASQNLKNTSHGSVSVWNTTAFKAPSPNAENLFFRNDDITTRSEFRAADWVSIKTTK